MSTDARSRPVPRSWVPLVALLAVLAAAAATIQPLAGIGLAIVALGVTLARGRAMPRLGYVAILATAVAAIVGPNLAVPGAPSVFAFRIIIVAVWLAFIGYVLLGGRLPWVRGLGTPTALVVLWVTWSALSIGWSENRPAALRWTFFLAMMTSMAVGLALVCRTPRRAVTLLKVLGVTFLVAVLIAMAELTTGFRLPTSALLGRDPEVAFGATSLFGNQNNFATYLTLSLPYFLVLPVVFRDIRLRALGVAGSILALASLLYTGSKSNLLALGIILVSLIAFMLTDRRRRGLAIVAIGVAGAAVVLVVPSVLGAGIIPLPQRAVTKFNFGLLDQQVQSDTGSGGVRSSLAHDGLAMVVETGGLGVGAGNAETRVLSLANFPGVSNLHDWWLEVLVDGGVVGFALWVGLYLLLLRACLQAGRRAREPLVRYLGLAGGLALLGFITGALGPSTAIHFAPMWITVALTMMTLVLARRSGAAGA